MKIVRYAVYDLDSGEVVHLHAEPAGLDTSPDEIIQIADPRRARRLGVLPVPIEVEPSARLVVAEGHLQVTDKDVGMGAAAGAGDLMEPDIERRYEIHKG
jgi:hypothetical protein